MTKDNTPTALSDVELDEANGGITKWIDKSSADLILFSRPKVPGVVKEIDQATAL
ncbi:MAG: hypothetical protein AAGH68_04440 [Pseudomonadota bacterium]